MRPAQASAAHALTVRVIRMKLGALLGSDDQEENEATRPEKMPIAS